VYTTSEIKKLRDIRNDWSFEFTGEEKSEFVDYEIPTPSAILSPDEQVDMSIDFDDI